MTARVKWIERRFSFDFPADFYPEILTRLRVWFFKSLIPLAPARTSKYRAGDLLSRITSDIKTLEDFYVRSLAPPLVAILIGLGTGIFFYAYHPIIAG